MPPRCRLLIAHSASREIRNVVETPGQTLPHLTSQGSITSTELREHRGISLGSGVKQEARVSLKPASDKRSNDIRQSFSAG